jgi:hypothetical protein
MSGGPDQNRGWRIHDNERAARSRAGCRHQYRRHSAGRITLTLMGTDPRRPSLPGSADSGWPRRGELVAAASLRAIGGEARAVEVSEQRGPRNWMVRLATVPPPCRGRPAVASAQDRMRLGPAEEGDIRAGPARRPCPGCGVHVSGRGGTQRPGHGGTPRRCPRRQHRLADSFPHTGGGEHAGTPAANTRVGGPIQARIPAVYIVSCMHVLTV